MPRPWTRPDHRWVLLAALLLPGCSGFGVFLDDTHNPNDHVNRPIGNSETMRRVEGKQVAEDPLTAESGNVWPGPVPPEPTLEDLQKMPPQPLPDLKGATIPSLSNVPNLNIPVIPHHLQPRPGEDGGLLGGPLQTGPFQTGPLQTGPLQTGPLQTGPLQVGPLHTDTMPGGRLPPAASPQGTIAHTPRGDAIGTAHPGGIPQSNVPAQPSSVVVPNGNGTSTVISPNGTISTIPTPNAPPR